MAKKFLILIFLFIGYFVKAQDYPIIREIEHPDRRIVPDGTNVYIPTLGVSHYFRTDREIYARFSDGTEECITCIDQGSTGPEGPQGIQGNPGNDGMDGREVELQLNSTNLEWRYVGELTWNDLGNLQGPQGIQGDTGPAGNDGVDGQDGAIGPQGPQGEQGIAGVDGTNGIDGTAATISVGTVTTGAPGSSVIFTNIGNSNAAIFDITIPRGDSGADGNDGSIGPQGPQGEIGPQGPAGTNGTDGLDGADGADGLSAYEVWINEGNSGTELDFLNSLIGATGPQGIQGIQGPQGIQGNPGNDGAQGPQGEIGPQGPAGNDGATGPAGADGVDGQGVVTGGTAGQLLAKIDNTDFNTEWVDPPSGGGAEVNDLSVVVTWANIPDANVPLSAVTQHGDGRYLQSVPSEFITETEGDARYLQSYSESDPTVASHIKSITTLEKSNWNEAHGWGDHSTQGYLTTDNDNQDLDLVGNILSISNDPNTDVDLSIYLDDTVLDESTVDGYANNNGYLTSYTETDPTVNQALIESFGFVTGSHFTPSTLLADYSFTDNSGNWDTAFSWGNHSTQGYLTSFTEINDLSANVIWTNIPNGNITETSITQHQSALNLTQSQITDLPNITVGTVAPGSPTIGDLWVDTN